MDKILLHWNRWNLICKDKIWMQRQKGWGSPVCSNILGLITDHWSLITSVLGRSEEISHADVLTRLKSTRINSPYVVLYKENSRKMHLKLLRLWWVWWHWCLPQRLAQIAQEACSPQLCNKPSANHRHRQTLHNLKFTYFYLNIFMMTPNICL